jgi:hypothetical protein
MPTINNIRLTIGRAEDSRLRRVTVQYQVCFTACEALAESTFVERVVLRGDDFLFDNDLITLRNTCVRAQRGCVDRSVSATVSTATLDEDGDTIFLGIVLNADRDEIYARVTLKPFTPPGASGDSNQVTGQFGPGA